MTTLDLVNSTVSDIKYEISKFPDGQQDVKIVSWQNIVPIEIRSEFKSFSDLELIISATKALKRLGYKQITLNIPYLLGARSDRQFIEGGTSYLVDVIAPLINAQNYDKVICYDVHSDVAAACINNFHTVNNYDFVSSCIQDILTKTTNNIRVVSPDGGALKKIYKTLENLTLGYGQTINNDVLVCSKSRGTDGKLSKTNVPLEKDLIPTDYIIIDDICDGGRTFINIANEIRQYHDAKEIPCEIHLIVSHGIFSQGIDVILEKIDSIYCTNSYKKFNFDNPKFHQLFIF